MHMMIFLSNKDQIMKKIRNWWAQNSGGDYFSERRQWMQDTEDLEDTDYFSIFNSICESICYNSLYITPKL